MRIETDLLRIVPRDRWGEVPDLFIFHGRRTCDAKRPECERCTVEPWCPSSQEAGFPDLFRVPRKKRPAKKNPKAATKKKPVAGNRPTKKT
ncbi:MAG: hypothetical protein GEU78_17215 [Actinobacteria bacterium]|nr:hypothetical protein [Actinomycetota bacterium]